METVLVVGLSGVGKSTLISTLASMVRIKRLEASSLLKSAFARRQHLPPTSEELRLGAVERNQEFLLSEFAIETEGIQGVVVLDAHLLIDGRDGLVEIPFATFDKMAVSIIVFVHGQPNQIIARRNSDSARVRPARDAAELCAHQIRELTLASDLALRLGVPLIVLQSSEASTLARFMTVYSGTL